MEIAFIAGRPKGVPFLQQARTTRRPFHSREASGSIRSPGDREMAAGRGDLEKVNSLLRQMPSSSTGSEIGDASFFPHRKPETETRQRWTS